MSCQIFFTFIYEKFVDYIIKGSCLCDMLPLDLNCTSVNVGVLSDVSLLKVINCIFRIVSGIVLNSHINKLRLFVVT